MNYAQSFEEFSSGLSTTDLALYAGVGVVLFILFKDRLSPVQKMLMDLVDSVKSFFTTTTTKVETKNMEPNINISVPQLFEKTETVETAYEDTFFELVLSWKQTRDLALKSGCDKAVEMLDEVFQFLSPAKCDLTENK